MNIIKTLYNSQIYNYCYEFGSRYLGVETKDSDYDYYCLQKHFETIQNNLVKFGFICKNSSYFENSYEFTKENIKIHIAVCQTEKEMACWKIACLMLKRGVPKIFLRDKDCRVKLFKDCRTTLTYFFANDEVDIDSIE